MVLERLKISAAMLQPGEDAKNRMALAPWVGAGGGLLGGAWLNYSLAAEEAEAPRQAPLRQAHVKAIERLDRADALRQKQHAVYDRMEAEYSGERRRLEEAENAGARKRIEELYSAEQSTHAREVERIARGQKLNRISLRAILENPAARKRLFQIVPLVTGIGLGAGVGVGVAMLGRRRG